MHFWNDKKKLWVEYQAATYPYVKTWDSVTGGLVLNTADFALYDNISVNARITTTTTGSSFLDEFTIVIKDKCRDATLVAGTQIAVKALDGTTKTSTNPFIWHMW